MPNDIFEGVALKDLHHFIGVNCYQYALGIETPIVVNVNNGFAYINMTPGGRKSGQLDKTAYRPDVIKGCEEDGAIDIGQKVSFKRGYKTVALYFHPTANDFHIVIVNRDGTAEDKIKMRRVMRARRHDDLKLDYEFDRYLLLPDGQLPPWLAQFQPLPLRLRGAKSADLNCLMIEGMPESLRTLSAALYLNPTDSILLTKAPDENKRFSKMGEWWVASIPRRYKHVVRPFQSLLTNSLQPR